MSVITIFRGMKIDLSKYHELELSDGLALAKAITELGDGKAEAYVVGGCVRDLVRHQLGQASTVDIHDVDIATSLSLEELKANFQTVSNNGEKHGTLLVFWNTQYFEVTHFRVDGDYSDGRHPDDVSFTSSFEEDTARRDFTINALGMNWDGEIIDFHGGVEDIKKRTIRAVGNPDERFKEDALRMIRAVRFAVNFDYIIDNNTSSAISKNAELVEHVSNERIRSEFLKLSAYDNMPDFIDRLIWVGLIKHIRAFVGMDWYEVKCNLIECDDLLTADNLFPAICYTANDESNLEAFVPTREERKMWNWLRSYRNVYAWDPDSKLYWTSLVEFVSGQFELLLALNADLYCDRAWLSKLPAASYLLQNPPDMKAISKRVADMGIPQGKAFGEKVKELTEAEYAKMAAVFPNTVSLAMGNSTLVYKIESVK